MILPTFGVQVSPIDPKPQIINPKSKALNLKVKSLHLSPDGSHADLRGSFTLPTKQCFVSHLDLGLGGCQSTGRLMGGFLGVPVLLKEWRIKEMKTEMI